MNAFARAGAAVAEGSVTTVNGHRLALRADSPRTRRQSRRRGKPSDIRALVTGLKPQWSYIPGENASCSISAITPVLAVAARVQAACKAVETALGDHRGPGAPYASGSDPLRPADRSPECRAPCGVPGRANCRCQRLARAPAVVLLVYYAPEAGADLRCWHWPGLTPEQLIDLGMRAPNTAYAIGFAPAFAYLGQVDERIAAAWLATPRLRVLLRRGGHRRSPDRGIPPPSPGG